MDQLIQHALEPPAFRHLHRQVQMVQGNAVQLGPQLFEDRGGVRLCQHDVDARQQLLPLGLVQVALEGGHEIAVVGATGS